MICGQGIPFSSGGSVSAWPFLKGILTSFNLKLKELFTSVSRFIARICPQITGGDFFVVNDTLKQFLYSHYLPEIRIIRDYSLPLQLPCRALHLLQRCHPLERF